MTKPHKFRQLSIDKQGYIQMMKQQKVPERSKELNQDQFNDYIQIRILLAVLENNSTDVYTLGCALHSTRFCDSLHKKAD